MATAQQSKERQESNAERFERLEKSNADLQKLVTEQAKTLEQFHLQNTALVKQIAQTQEAKGKTTDEVLAEVARDKNEILRRNGLLPEQFKARGEYLWTYILTPRKNRVKEKERRVNYPVIYPFRAKIGYAPGASEAEQNRVRTQMLGYLRARGYDYKPTDLVLECHGKVDSLPREFLAKHPDAPIKNRSLQLAKTKEPVAAA